MKRFQFLSLISGCIRGAFITFYLCGLEQKLGPSVAESFDLIAAPSIGKVV